jgi:hypothetical protein
MIRVLNIAVASTLSRLMQAYPAQLLHNACRGRTRSCSRARCVPWSTQADCCRSAALYDSCSASLNYQDAALPCKSHRVGFTALHTMLSRLRGSQCRTLCLFCCSPEHHTGEVVEHYTPTAGIALLPLVIWSSEC